MKRQRGRNRNNNNNRNRSLESNGPDVKVRGSASTIYEKYTQLTHDAKTGGNRVKAESLRQHAEHYLRLMNEQEAQREAEREARDAERNQRSDRNDRSNSNDDDGSDRQPSRRQRSNKSEDQLNNQAEGMADKADKDESPKPRMRRPRETDDNIAAAPDAREDKPKRRRRAPVRDNSGNSETIEAAE